MKLYLAGYTGNPEKNDYKLDKCNQLNSFFYCGPPHGEVGKFHKIWTSKLKRLFK